MPRTKAIEMNAEEIAAFLASTRTITLVSHGHRGFPHPMPMWFVRDPDGTIRMTTYRASQKVKNIERDARVALSAESGTEYDELRGIVLYGRAEVIDEHDFVVATMIEAARLEGPDAEQVVERSAGKRVVIRVVPERIVSWDHRKLPRVP